VGKEVLPGLERDKAVRLIFLSFTCPFLPKHHGGVDAVLLERRVDSIQGRNLETNHYRFIFERVVTNWDTSYLEGRLHSLIASLSYRGLVEIRFPITHNRVVVQSPDKVNRLFTNVTQLFTGTKKYAVVKAVWPYASVPPGVANRKFAVQSEEAWWNDWKDAIRGAVLSRRKGWVTVEDRLESLMTPPKDGGPVGEWGLDV
jgi:hypothetical protein